MQANGIPKVTVLLTSAGVTTAVNVISALRSATDIDARIIAADMSGLSAGLFLADSSHRVPPVDDGEYIPRLMEICERETVDFLFPLYSGEVRLFSQNAALFRKNKIGLMVPKPDVVDRCVDKEHFYSFLADKGFSYPRIYNDTETVDLGFPLIVKPREGSSSKNTHKIDDLKALRFYLGRHPGSIVQDFIEGQEYTVDCMVHSDGLYACIPRSRISIKDGKSVIGQTVDHPGLIDKVAGLLKAIGLEGPCNVQCIEDKKGDLYFVEINPRLSAGGLPLTVKAGANIPEMMVKLHLGLSVTPVINYRKNLYMMRYLEEVFAMEGAEGLRRI